MVVEEDILGHFDKVEEACRYLIFQMLGVVVEDMVAVGDIVVVVEDMVVGEDMVVVEDIEVVVVEAYKYLYVVKAQVEVHKVVEEDS